MSKSMENSIKEMEKIQKAMNDLAERYQKIKISCRHRKGSGQPKLEMLHKKDRNKYDKGDVRCKRCDTEFNIRLIREEDLMVAVRTLHNAIHQIILYSDGGDRDAEFVTMLGQMDYNMLKVGKRYIDIVLRKGKKNKKKKKNKNNYGGAKYVSSGLF